MAHTSTPDFQKKLTIELKDRFPCVTLRRHCRAQRVALRFDAVTARFFLTLPLRTSLSDALTFLDRQRGWMQACLAKSELGQQKGRIPLVPGVEFPIRGELYCIRHDPKGLRRPRQDKNILWVGGPEERIPARIAAWLRDEATKDLLKATSDYALQLEKNVTSVTVRDTRSQWGSCTARGALSFSWRLILAPRLVLGYVAAHETAHLVEMNHGCHFWALVARLHPDPNWARRWLRHNRTGLHRYG